MPHRRSAEAARAAIQQTALTTFVTHGYQGTSLEAIAERLGLTRQAVLYHFGSKEELLRSVVVPSFEKIEQTVDHFVVGDPPTQADRRRVLRGLVDVFCEHRAAVALLARFHDGAEVTHIVPGLIELNEKVSRLLGGSAVESDPVLRVRVLAAMAALIGIMGARLNVPLDTPEERVALVRGCLAMLGR